MAREWKPDGDPRALARELEAGAARARPQVNGREALVEMAPIGHFHPAYPKAFAAFALALELLRDMSLARS